MTLARPPHTSALSVAAGLHCVRLDPAAWALQAASNPPPLGGLGWGLAAPGLAGLELPVLSAGGPQVDAWLGQGGTLRHGRSGAVQWQADDRWAFGQLDLPDVEGDLSGVARQAYLDIFAALRACGHTHVLRLWNYLPRINGDGGGMERYRQFNIGRQQAFMEAGHDAFEGAPAACALGLPDARDMPGGGLHLRFLAASTAPRPLENPRQVPAYRYSSTYGPRAPTFSRAALADAGGGRVALFVSGTASIVGEHSVHHGDVLAQARETLVNLQAVLDAANARCTAGFTFDDLHCTVYVRHAGDAASVLALLAAAQPGAPAPLCVQADVCRAELLVEIEAHAFAPGALT